MFSKLDQSELDWIESFRKWFIPKLGRVARFLRHNIDGLWYVRGKVGQNQFVGKMDMSTEEFEHVLEEMGFERNPVAALKHRPTARDDVAEGSWRKIGYEEAPDMQLHVTIFDSADVPNAAPGNTFVFAHWEERWDTKPLSHYRANNFDPEKGVAMVRDLLNRYGYSWDSTRPSAYSSDS